jgi:hypothetical protein
MDNIMTSADLTGGPGPPVPATAARRERFETRHRRPVIRKDARMGLLVAEAAKVTRTSQRRTSRWS